MGVFVEVLILGICVIVCVGDHRTQLAARRKAKGNGCYGEECIILPRKIEEERREGCGGEEHNGEDVDRTIIRSSFLLPHDGTDLL